MDDLGNDRLVAELLEIERIIGDEAGQADKGQEDKPCQHQAHSSRVIPLGLAPLSPQHSCSGILASETKERLNAKSTGPSTGTFTQRSSSVPAAPPLPPRAAGFPSAREWWQWCHGRACSRSRDCRHAGAPDP